MFIKNVKIENFKGLDNIDVDLGKFNFLAEPNGKGKSSFIEALAVALGKSKNDAMNRNGNPFRVMLDIECNGESFDIEKTPLATKMCGKSVSGKAITRMLGSLTGTDEESIKLVASIDKLENMNEEELSDFFNSLPAMQVPITKSFVIGLASSKGLSSKAVELLDNYFEASFDKKEIEAGEKFFTEARKNLNRTLKCSPVKTVQEPKRNLKDIEAELSKLIADKAIADNNKSAELEYQKAVAKKEKAENDLQAINKTINELANKTLGFIADENIKRSHITAIENLKASIMTSKMSIDTLNKNNETHQKTLNSLMENKCPLSDAITCTTDKSEIMEDIKNLIEYNNENISYILSDIKIAEENLEKAKKKKEQYEQEEALFVRLKNEERNRDFILANMPVLPPKPPVASTIATYDAQKKLLEEEKQNFLEYEKMLEEIKKQEEQKALVSAYSEIIVFLGNKSGVKQALIEKASALFEKNLNTYVKKFNSNWEVKMKVENGIAVTMRRNANEQFRPLQSLSSGERLMLEALMVNLINGLSNTGLLILDNLDKLDKENFVSLLKLITEPSFSDGFETIILSFVNHEGLEKEVQAYPVFYRVRL